MSRFSLFLKIPIMFMLVFSAVAMYRFAILVRLISIYSFSVFVESDMVVKSQFSGNLGFRVKVAVGFEISDVDKVNRLISCDKAKRISACGKPLFFCLLTCLVCRSCGKCVTFRYYSQSGIYRVIWVCERAGVFC